MFFVVSVYFTGVLYTMPFGNPDRPSSGSMNSSAECADDTEAGSETGHERGRHMRRRVMTTVALILNILFLGAVVLVWRARDAALLKDEELRQFDILTRSVAHEILNPLNAIGLSVQSMDRKLSRLQDDQLKGFMNGKLLVIRQEIDRLNAMVRGFRSLSGNVKTEPGELPLRKTAIEVIALFSAKLEDTGVEIVNEIPDDLMAWADENLVKQIMINLVKNSIEAIMDDQREKCERNLPVESCGIIKLRALEYENAVKEDLLKGLRSTMVEDEIMVLVEDDGPGISKGREEQIFQPDFSGKSGGFGLGLTICRKLSEAMGGRISAAMMSSSGGARFTLILPGMKLGEYRDYSERSEHS
ncbi:MAG: hypothetical protein CVV64_16905 [Candidatus Wallbacteria bacterium HGW-Wallbacteria-1]|jgi:two-component system sensor kinase FixL|uniref:histidine kinase n=1 Tax=Candidatus Wallbacteria bacterium HGW-Wallbacteria-1 TaxID=2013854 RepID=A0A2N1PKK1_9BACT|nr:MAG: hypothetical protein CVV64_16905 [Candidatus Wallbacteria bacterium HGW-Wallbacteria-1]